MKIAVNTRFLLTDKLEGIGWFTHEVVRRLVAWHPDWEFVFLFDRPFDDRFLFGPNVSGIVVPPPARHPVLWYLWFEWTLPAALRRCGADVFFSPDGFCSLSTPVKTLMVTHDLAHLHFPAEIPLAARYYYHHFVPRYLRRADAVVAVSEFTKSDIVGNYGLAAGKIAVSCNGCREGFVPLSPDNQTLVRTKYSGGQPYFLYVGAVHPRKNIHRLIQAFDRFKTITGAPVKLLIGGRFTWQTGTIRSAWEAAVHKEDILFMGYVPEAELPELTASALALTYVSLFEGFGVPLLEAMHCDTPVLTSNVSSMPEVAGDAALKVDPENVEQIVAALKNLYEDATLRKTLIEAGRHQRTFYTWDAAAKVVERAILHLTP